MRNQTKVPACKGWIVVPALWLAISALAADAPQIRGQQAPAPTASTQPEQDDLELEQVLVEGRRPESDTRKLRSWIDRLVGQFRYEGEVERYSADGVVMDRAEVHGGAQCFRFGKAVAVQCQINATWPEMHGPNGADVPGGVSSLTPAIAVYALDARKKFIGYLQVDNNGVAAGGTGWIVDDTYISRAPCADFPGKCERVVRLEAPPDGTVVRMRVDLERDGKLQVRYNFQWKRLPQGQMAEVPAPAPTASLPVARVSTSVPSNIDAWLRRMVGQYRVRAMRSCTAAISVEVDESKACREFKADVAEATRKGPVEAECQGIGTGPGVRCVTYMAWPETGIPASKRESMKSNPGFMLYGFDPVQQGIAVLGVGPTSDVGPGGFDVGQLKGDKLISCPHPPCSVGVGSQVFIPPGGEWIQIRGITVADGSVFGLESKLYRMREVASGDAAKAPRVPTNLSPRGR